MHVIQIPGVSGNPTTTLCIQALKAIFAHHREPRSLGAQSTVSVYTYARPGFRQTRVGGWETLIGTHDTSRPHRRQDRHILDSNKCILEDYLSGKSVHCGSLGTWYGELSRATEDGGESSLMDD
jgi:hypothetical protein